MPRRGSIRGGRALYAFFDEVAGLVRGMRRPLPPRAGDGMPVRFERDVQAVTYRVRVIHMAGPAHQAAPPDEEVTRQLYKVWRLSGWERLEMYRDPLSGEYSGHCVAPGGLTVEVGDALRSGTAPDAITRLQGLLLACGWQRLEVTGRPGQLRAGGRCARGDGSVLGFEYPQEREGALPARGTSILPGHPPGGEMAACPGLVAPRQ